MPISLRDVFFVYNEKTPLEAAALKGINLEFKEGSFTALVGRTGCGKSTLVQHLNALLNPSKGVVEVDGFVNSADKKTRTKKMSELRHKVGLVFQFPEYQLFEENVEKDVAFAPKNFGMSKEDALEAAHKALEMVGLGPSFYKRSPFELSGGEKRKVAIAGILAFHPSVLVVDEPTAGLDPFAAEAVMDLFKKIHDEGTTVILVTHDMDLVLKYADTVVVMNDGKIAGTYAPKELFNQDITKYSLDAPMVYSCGKEMIEKGLSNLDVKDVVDIKTLASAIVKAKGESK